MKIPAKESARTNKMPIPNPKGPEAKKNFVNRCMGDNVMTKEFPDGKQRAAVCYSKWKKAEANKETEWKAEEEDSKVILY